MKFQNIFAVSAAILSGVSASPVMVAKRAVGKLTYHVFLKSLPEGMTFTLDTVTPTKVGAGIAYSNVKQEMLPKAYTVSETAQMGEFTLDQDASGTLGSAFKSGPGAYYDITFTVSGKSPDGTEGTEKGHMKIASSDWGWLARPDEGIITYGFDGSEDVKHEVPTPSLTTPDNVYLDIFYDSSKQLAMKVSNDIDWLTKAARVVINNVFELHAEIASEVAFGGHFGGGH